MSAIKTLIDNLNVALADLDAKFLEDSLKWAEGRVDALFAYRKSDDYKERCKKGAWGGHYQIMFDLCGGKTWYQLFSGNGFSECTKNFIAKNCKAVIEKRNASIAKKLEKAGVVSVIDNTFTYSDDGFHGIFRINTDTGVKVVTIETIYAGGWNIQRAHTRTLIKVK